MPICTISQRLKLPPRRRPTQLPSRKAQALDTISKTVCNLFIWLVSLTYLYRMTTYKIAVIGAGWLGLPLAKALQADGHAVTATSTTAQGVTKLEAQGLSAKQLKIGPKGGAELSATDILVVTLPLKGDQDEARATIGQIAKLAKAAEAQHVIYISSTAVYPDCNGEVTEEDAADIPSTHTGLHILLLEKHLTGEVNCPLTILRLGGLFGPGRQPGRFLSGKKVVPGPHSPVNMTHLDDAIGSVRQVISRPFPKTDAIYNVVAQDHPTRKTFYDLAMRPLRV
jgi:nucleoside-diphosphate-sugar epimerase